jgi:tRNA 2-thiouridine synthesizing protein B
MSMLHIINKSPYERNALDSCLRYALPGAAVLLVEDGVYAASKGNAAAAKLSGAMEKGIKVYALQPDIEARGMQDRLMQGVNLVDYGGFVDLVTEHKNCQSWL